jgi:hypothetical protein
MMQHDENSCPVRMTVTFITPPFAIFMTGGLSDYAADLGIPNSTSYWCPWCLLSHVEWDRPPETFHVIESTSKFLTDMATAVKMTKKKVCSPTDQKGVTCDRHYTCLGPENFVAPLLHLEIGMVNPAREQFEQWVDNVVEIVPPAEMDAQKEVVLAQERLHEALEATKSDGTINI